MKKINLISYLLLCITIVFAGCGDDCPPSPRSYQIIGINNSISKITKINGEITFTSTIDSSRVFTDSVIYTIIFSKTYFASKPNYNFSLVNSAYACSPVKPKPRNGINSFVLVANENFNDSIKKNDVINPKYYSVNDYQASDSAIFYNNLTSNNFNNSLKLLVKPYPNTYQSFTFKIVTSDNKGFESKSRTLLFVN